MNTEAKETDDSEDVPGRTKSQIEWLERRTPPEWELVSGQLLRPILRRGDQRVTVDLTQNRATWEKRVGTPLKPAIRPIGDDRDIDDASNRSLKPETVRWVEQDRDEYERICPLVVGRIWRLEDSIAADSNGG